MSTRTTRGPQPLELPDGCRMVAERMPDGRTYTVALATVESDGWDFGHIPATVLGDFPRRPKTPRKAKSITEGASLFAAEGPPSPPPPEPLIVVYAQPGHLDQAQAFASVLIHRGYAAEARAEPVTPQRRSKNAAR